MFVGYIYVNQGCARDMDETVSPVLHISELRLLINFHQWSRWSNSDPRWESLSNREWESSIIVEVQSGQEFLVPLKMSLRSNLTKGYSARFH